VESFTADAKNQLFGAFSALSWAWRWDPFLSVDFVCTNHFYCHSEGGGRKMTPLLLVVGIS